MRIHLKIKSDGTVVPFNHLKMLTGTIHKWIGAENKEHGKVSLYSFSWLQGARKSANGKGLKFENGTSFFISAFDVDFVKTIIANIQKDPEMFHGLRVYEIIMQPDPNFETKDVFEVASPVFIKRKEGERTKHYKFNELITSQLLKESLLTKMKIAGLTDDTLDISFDLTYLKAHTKLVHYGEIKNEANVCPIIIKGKPETKAFAWNVGIGNSTGVGFGALK